MQSSVLVIWRDVLGRDDVGLDDNFFDLGGDSALLATAHRRTQELAGRDLPVVEFFRHTTVRALSGWLESLRDAPAATGAARRAGAGRARVAALRASRAGQSSREPRTPDDPGVGDV